MLGYLLKHLLDNYQVKRMFVLNDNEVKMGLKDMKVNMKLVKTEFNPTKAQHSIFRDRYFHEIKKKKKLLGDQ